MRTIFILRCVAFTLCSGLGFATEAQTDPGLKWTGSIEIIERAPKAVRVVVHSNDPQHEWRLTIRIPDGSLERWPAAPNSFKYAAFLESEDDDSRHVLDELVTKKFGSGSRQTILKPRGYVAASILNPSEIAKRGGDITLVDPAIDGGLTWTIKLELNFSAHTALVAVDKASG